jgi:hypothetical protein
MIRATVYARSQYNPCFEAGESRTFGTERAAELWAASVLPPTVTTNDCYHRDVGRAPSVRLARVDGNGESKTLLRYVEAPVVIHRSVGELGYGA